MSTKKEYKLLIGSRAQVMHGTAKKTGGGLRKNDLKYNKYGKIVSKRASKSAKKCNNLVNAGYVTQKGSFGVIKKNQKGGIAVIETAVCIVALGVFLNSVFVVAGEDILTEKILNFGKLHESFHKNIKSTNANEFLILSFIGIKKTSSPLKKILSYALPYQDLINQFRIFKLFFKNNELFLKWCDINQKKFTCLKINKNVELTSKKVLQEDLKETRKKARVYGSPRYKNDELVSITLDNVGYNARNTNGELSDEKCQGNTSFGKKNKTRSTLEISEIIKGKYYDPYNILNFNGEKVNLLDKVKKLRNTFSLKTLNFLKNITDFNMLSKESKEIVGKLVDIVLMIEKHGLKDDLLNLKSILNKYFKLHNFLINSCIFEEKNERNMIQKYETKIKQALVVGEKEMHNKNNYRLLVQQSIGDYFKYNDYINNLYVNFYKFVLFKNDDDDDKLKIKLFIIIDELYDIGDGPQKTFLYENSEIFNDIIKQLKQKIENTTSNGNIKNYSLNPFLYDEYRLCFEVDDIDTEHIEALVIGLNSIKFIIGQKGYSLFNNALINVLDNFTQKTGKYPLY